ncbi:restriction endonuclease subunit S [Micromonospora sp. NPDC048905]|uniref:restriction endonuclease subunit S n=1 Tax=Micromonospora sp. NPDC048905 TaxID=3155494 RepID=UPI0033DB60E3
MTKLPAGWTLAPLGDLVTINPRRFDREPGDDDMVSVVPMAAVEAESGRMDPSQTSRYGDVKKRTLTPFQEGDVLFAKVTPCMENGKIAVARGTVGGRAFGSTELFALRSNGAIDPSYLCNFLLQPGIRREAQSVMTGAVGLRRVPRAYLEELLIPLPPLAEQCRIVAALDDHLSQLAAGVALLEAATIRLHRFKKSCLSDAASGLLSDKAGDLRDAQRVRRDILNGRQSLVQVGGRGRPDPLPPLVESELPFPEHWAVMSLEQVTHPARTISYGILKPGPHVSDGIPYIRVINMRGDRLALDDLHRTSSHIDAQYARSRLASGDVLVSIRGTYGRIVRVPPVLVGANITQDTARLAFLDQVDPDFACIYLRSAFFQRHLRRVARGVAVKGVNIGDLREAPFPVPPFDEQREIVTRMLELNSQQETMLAAVSLASAEAKVLRRKVLMEAFSGRIVRQDPNDEPVSDLLARIRAERAAAAPRQKARSIRTRNELAAPPTRVTGDNYHQEALPL